MTSKVSNHTLETLGCRQLTGNLKACVAILGSAEKEFNGLDERKLSRLLRIMELWCDNQRLTEEQFNGNEGREQKGAVNVLVQAFKTHKNRLYGTVLQIENRRTFVIVEVDPAKKQTKADPAILKRAKDRCVVLAGELAKPTAAQPTAGRRK